MTDANPYSRTLEALSHLGPRDIAALYYGTWCMLRDAQENQALPRSRRLDSPATRVEVASGYVRLLAEAIVQLPAVDRRKAEAVQDFLAASVHPAMRSLGERLGRALEQAA